MKPTSTSSLPASAMRASLLTQVKTELGTVGAGAPALTSRAVVEKIYEIFVFTCVMKALASLDDTTLSPRDSQGNPTSNLVFRLGPGRIYAPTSAPGFILVTYRGRTFEILNGVKVLGRSRILHELDVCLIEHGAAGSCRRRRQDPQQKAIKFLAECKFYGTDLPLHIGREYLGLCDEFDVRIKTIVSNVGDDNVHALVTRHRGTENFEMSPWQRKNRERFIQWLANELRQVLA